jgi:hypothetical protein
MITRNSDAGFYRKYRGTCAIAYAPSTYSAKKNPKIPARAPITTRNGLSPGIVELQPIGAVVPRKVDEDQENEARNRDIGVRNKVVYRCS